MRIKSLLLIFLIFISGCALTPERIVKNPDKIIEICSKIENQENDACITKYASEVSLLSKETGINLCNKIASNSLKNKCLFKIFSVYEKSGRLEEGIEVCKNIDIVGFPEWCETRRSVESIAVSPPIV